MNTIDRSALPRTFGRVASAMLGVVALSSLVLACASPTEPEPNESTPEPASQSEALINNGGGPGNTSTCTSRWQSCYASCGGLYGGGKDPRSEAICEDLCDSIHSECSPLRAIGATRAVTTGAGTAVKVGP